MESRLGHLLTGCALAVGALAANLAVADATIINPTGSVALGVGDFGNLIAVTGSVLPVNTMSSSPPNTTGLAFKFADGSFRDAIASGCSCEGWGVSASAVSGSVNPLYGPAAGLGLTSFASATSMTSLTALPGLSVKHEYAPAPTSGALFKARVTIANTTGGPLSDLRYVRVLDWSVPTTESDEFVTIRGTGNASFLERSHNNGFETADPLGSEMGVHDLATEDADVDRFQDIVGMLGSDQGAYFRFYFGSLAAGASREFDIFYGAAATRALAETAIAQEAIELFAMGQSDNGSDQADDSAPTFVIGFANVGGSPIFAAPGEVPEPGTIALAALGLTALAVLRRRRYA